MEILALAQAGQKEISDAERKGLEADMKALVKTLTGKDAELVPGATDMDITSLLLKMLAIEAVSGTEEATNAGIPSAAATLFLGRSGIIRYKGSTPLGTSAGVDEAIHYVDSIVLPGPLTQKYADLFKDAGDGTFRFKKAVDANAVAAKNDKDLTALWVKAQRYDGKGCMDAVKHIETVLAGAFTGKRLVELGTLLEADQKLLALEREQAIANKRLDPNAPLADQVQCMQRKGVLGMNAILSMSLALGRAIAAKDGRELWQLIRDMAAETMVKFIAANGQGKSADALKKLSFEDLKKEFRTVSLEAIKANKTLYALLRDQLPVYAAATGK